MGRFFYTYLMCKPKKERIHIMNPTTEKLKKLIKNSISFGPDDPIYKEPAGVIFTGPSRKPGKKPRKTSKPEKEN